MAAVCALKAERNLQTPIEGPVARPGRANAPICIARPTNTFDGGSALQCSREVDSSHLGLRCTDELVGRTKGLAENGFSHLKFGKVKIN